MVNPRRRRRSHVRSRRRNPGVELALGANPRRRRYTRRRYRNPGALALAANPRRRRGFRRMGRASLGRLTSGFAGLNWGDILGTTAGFAGNLLLLKRLPAQVQQPGWKYIPLVGIPLLAKMVLKGSWGARLATGGVLAAAVHLVNDFVLKGQLLPSEIAYSPAGTTRGLFGYETGVRGLGADANIEEIERALGAESDLDLGAEGDDEMGAASYEMMGLGAEADAFRVV